MNEFLGRMKTAAEWAVLLGIKIAIVVAIVLVSVSFVLGDYNIVRGRAANGERAWEWIQSQQPANQQPSPLPK